MQSHALDHYPVPTGLAQRWLRPVLCAFFLVLVACGTGTDSGAAQQTSLPPVQPLTSARFDLMTSFAEGEAPAEVLEYGTGALALPDRVQLGVVPEGADPQTALTTLVQAGAEVYSNTADGQWQPITDGDFLSLHAVLLTRRLLERADQASTILKIKDEPVRDTPSTQYQLWFDAATVSAIAADLPGIATATRDRLAQAESYKVDVWLDSAGVLRQQYLTITEPQPAADGVDLPLMQTMYLVSYYDLNQPNIAIAEPGR